MKKKIFALFVIFSFLFSSFLSAESKQVPKAANDQTYFKKKNWQPWAVAIATILVATTGLVIVSQHKGKKVHHD
jgi:hypothetical protein